MKRGAWLTSLTVTVTMVVAVLNGVIASLANITNTMVLSVSLFKLTSKHDLGYDSIKNKMKL